MFVLCPVMTVSRASVSSENTSLSSGAVEKDSSPRQEESERSRSERKKVERAFNVVENRKKEILQKYRRESENSRRLWVSKKRRKLM